MNLDDAAVLPTERAEGALTQARERQGALERAQGAVHLVGLAQVTEQTSPRPKRRTRCDSSAMPWSLRVVC